MYMFGYGKVVVATEGNKDAWKDICYTQAPEEGSYMPIRITGEAPGFGQLAEDSSGQRPRPESSLGFPWERQVRAG